jgi:glycosyltransferase involved in cell wall biosynthesis
MKVTIAIPTYNNENTILKAIDSALHQDFLDDYEILIVNNNSTDNTLEIVENIEDTRLKIISNLETCTLFENHNVCLREASGDYIIFCHSDDELDPQALSILWRKIQERGMPKKYIAWGHSFFRDFSSALVNAKLQSGKIFAGIVAVGPFINGGLTPSGTCYSKSFIEIGGFLSTKYRLTPSDSSSMIYAALNGFRFEMLDELLFYRRDASTARKDSKKSDIEVAYLDAWSGLCEKINKYSQLDIIQASQSLRYVNPVFYNYMSQKYPREVLSGMLKKLIITPCCARDPLFWKTLFECLTVSRAS